MRTSWGEGPELRIPDLIFLTVPTPLTVTMIEFQAL